jgi:hypothetical protein
MKRILLFTITFFSVIFVQAQEEKWAWWNETHGWEYWMPGWRSFITISPGYLGPNALPVPDMRKGFLEGQKVVEASSDFHFSAGDQAQNISARFYYPFSDKVAIEVHGVILEHYSMTDEIRDERAARDKDGEGLAIGDLYFTTLVQLSKGRKFPNTLLRMAGRTASGDRLDAARHSDSPGYYFDLSFSKEIPAFVGNMQGLPYCSLGFYSWQTNDVENLQNDAFMYGFGFDLKNERWQLSNSLSGYSGYKLERDQPMVYTFGLKRELKKNALRLQYRHGLRDWEYQTVKISYLWQWK